MYHVQLLIFCGLEDDYESCPERRCGWQGVRDVEKLGVCKDGRSQYQWVYYTTGRKLI